jgi:hypothetical protein
LGKILAAVLQEQTDRIRLKETMLIDQAVDAEEGGMAAQQ